MSTGVQAIARPRRAIRSAVPTSPGSPRGSTSLTTRTPTGERIPAWSTVQQRPRRTWQCTSANGFPFMAPAVRSASARVFSGPAQRAPQSAHTTQC